MDMIDTAIGATINQRTDVSYLIVADRADVVNGKLYMMAGGWDRIQPASFPFTLMLGIAVGIRVPTVRPRMPTMSRWSLSGLMAARSSSRSKPTLRPAGLPAPAARI